MPGESPLSDLDLSELEFIGAVDRKVNETIVNNSFGILQKMSLEQLASKGKMLRPRMIHGMGRVFSAPVEPTIAWAASCELLHNASLIHDDLQDGEAFRRGRPTLWREHGYRHAINVGDFLLLIASQPILACSADPRTKIDLCRLLSRTAAHLANGQCLDIHRVDLDSENLTDDYFNCIWHKTSSFFSASATGVANISKLSQDERFNLAQLFGQIGHLYQIQDDLLDLGEPKCAQWPSRDLYEGKLTFPIICHLTYFPEDRSRLKKLFLDLSGRKEVATAPLMALMASRGIPEFSRSILHSRAQSVLKSDFLLARPLLRRQIASLLDLLLQPTLQKMKSKVEKAPAEAQA